MPQHHFQRKQRPGNRRVERHRHRRRHSASQQITPRDAVCMNAVRHPAGNHRGQMHHWPFAPAGPARGQRDHRGKGAGDALFLFNPAFVHCRSFDHIGNRTHHPVIGIAIQDQPHHQPAGNRDCQDPVPLQRFGECVQHMQIFGPVEPALQRRNPLAKPKCGVSRSNTDKQRYEPELDLAWPLLAQHPQTCSQAVRRFAQFAGRQCFFLVQHRQRPTFNCGL